MCTKMQWSTLASVLFIYLTGSAFCKPHTEAASREATEHFADDPERHDVQFDHNAFLGTETAQQFSKLTPEQSREKLKEIVNKIDQDADGKVTEKEMKEWISYVALSSAQQVTEKHWSEVNPKGLTLLSWEEYSENSYGPHEERMRDTKGVEEYTRALRHDKRRWKAADRNQDGNLSREEFHDFLNPEDKVHMREAVIEDDFLTEEEITAKQDMFIHSQAMNYGHLLKYPHSV
ncbi:Calumenin [Fasciola gigantica]|uniref:Reticulocalbin-3 n=1 Tax=Fasciola gigantica TaxID=46835 RepID=A0A504YTR4_FASGI|nr:Calumenin [Fasciola gigantica]